MTSTVDIVQLANYNSVMDSRSDGHLGKIIKQQRVALSMTLQEVAAKSSVSASHLGRIERGERFPSAHILQKIARPLGFEEDELFTLAGYLSPQSAAVSEQAAPYNTERIDPYVAKLLAQESVENQRAIIGILAVLKSIAKNIS